MALFQFFRHLFDSGDELIRQCLPIRLRQAPDVRSHQITPIRFRLYQKFGGRCCRLGVGCFLDLFGGAVFEQVF